MCAIAQPRASDAARSKDAAACTTVQRIAGSSIFGARSHEQVMLPAPKMLLPAIRWTVVQAHVVEEVIQGGRFDGVCSTVAAHGFKVRNACVNRVLNRIYVREGARAM